MHQFRIKVFIFVNAETAEEAEKIAAALIGASRSKAENSTVAQALVREGSAKSIVDGRKNGR